MRRRTLIIIGIVLALLLVGAGVYLRVRQSLPPTDEPPIGGGLPPDGSGPDDTATTTPGGLPPANVIPAARGAVLDYFVSGDGTTSFIQPSGEIIVASTTSVIVSQVKISNLLDAWFSNTGNYVLVKYGDPFQPDWSVYDFGRKAWRQLGIETRSVSWAPDADVIAYAAERPTATIISTMDVRAATLRSRTLTTMSAEDLEVLWAGSSRIMIFPRPSNEVPATLWVYDLKKSAIFLLYENLRGLDLAWGFGDRGLLLRAKTASGGAEIFMIDADGREVRAFSFLTMPDKCAFRSQSELLCGIPKDASAFRSKSLPDAYWKREFLTADALYTIDLDSGAIEVVANEVRDHDMIRAKIFGDFFYFVDRTDNLLYKVELPSAETQ